jgi:hypothetical protein
VSLVPDSKLAMFRLMLNVRDRYDPAIDPPSVSSALERLPEQLRRAPGAALISQESLATATSPQIERLLRAAGERDVEVVVTLRDLGRQIPSAWQQTLQTGRSQRFGRYLRRLQTSHGTDARIWANLDAAAILRRWSAHVPAERITVVTVPAPGAPRTALLDRFCEVIGVDPTTLTVDQSSRGNRGLRAEQAEVLRRVNAVLPPEFKRRDVYGDLGKRFFAVKILGGDTGTPIRLPDSLRAWCEEISREHVAHIRDGGYRVVGDLDDLIPHESAFAPEGARRTPNAVVAETATQAIADLLVDRMHEREAQRAQRRVETDQSPAVSRLARLVGRLRP